MRVRAVRAALAAAAIAAVTLAGCNGDAPEAGTVDEPTQSATTAEPTAEPTTEEPTDPETTESEPTEDSDRVEGGPVEVDDDDLKADAQAFVQSYLDAYDAASQTGDFDPVRAMQTDTCDRCKENVSWFVGLYDDGGRVEGGGFTEPKLSVEGSTADTVFVEVKSTIGAFEVFDSAGDVTQSSPAEPATSTFGIRKNDDDAWQVVSWAEGE